MSNRATDGGELPASDTEVIESGQVRVLRDCRLAVVGADHGYHGADFTAGETLPFDRLLHHLKRDSTSTAFVVDAGDRGKAYLLPVLWERYCQQIASEPIVAVTNEVVTKSVMAATSIARPIRVVNVKGMNKADQRARVVYVGRKFAGWPAHPLCNPFVPDTDEPAGECLRKYRAKIATRLTLERDLAALWAETGQGVRPLGCWCCNAVAGDGWRAVRVQREAEWRRFGGRVANAPGHATRREPCERGRATRGVCHGQRATHLDISGPRCK